MKRLALFASFVVLVFSSRVALAHDEHGSAGGGGGSASSSADEQPPPEVPIVSKEPVRTIIALDWVIGFGKVPAAEQKIAASTQIVPSNVLVSAPFRTQTFTLAAHHDFASFGLGARFPMTIGNINDAAPGITGENVFTSGNLELAIDTRKKLCECFDIIPELALVAPLAAGTSAPATQADLDKIPAGSFDKFAAYKYSTNLAAAAAHGYEDDALFWPQRVGIVPKVTLAWKKERFFADPYVKLPFMIDTHVDSDERARFEAVVGAKLGARVTDWLDVGARVWGTFPIAAQTGMRESVAVVEPQIRLHAESTFSLTVGGVLPFAGALVDPYVGGVRATAAVGF